MFTQINASAGSGKTYTLTRRFLALLEKASPVPSTGGCALHNSSAGYSLAEILAATFTNKAAAEMKNRVVRSLKEEALRERAALYREQEVPPYHTEQPDAQDAQPTHPARPRAATAETGRTAPQYRLGNAERWVEQVLRHYSSLNIRTIDSLLATLVRLSALQLGLPPDFEPSFDPAEYFTPLYDALMEELAPAEPVANTGFAPPHRLRRRHLCRIRHAPRCRCGTLHRGRRCNSHRSP
ncbi:UvrD-helicase domain-containing protein [Desulfovibrio sp. OttesenSCG-928-G15]|nr:UvrD-helicase domain-containing protein [Desulfovibrio sp. OttesenSCG-928-G15]